MNAIEIRGLRKTYATGTEALKGVDLSVEEGDFYALLGANGAGKTTIIGILCGLVNKTGGSASVFGLDTEKEPDRTKAMIGIVPQEFNFSIFEKAWDIVIAQAGYYGIPAKEAKPRAEEVLKALNLWEKKDLPSMTLSGGMKRRLMIARALMHKPKLLILDEPTAGVDVELRHGMWDYLRKLNAGGTTILLTTHYLEEAEQLCRHAAIISQGEIVRQGRMKDLVSGLDVQTYSLDLMEATDVLVVPSFVMRRIDADTLEADVKGDQTLNELLEALSAKGVKVKSIKQKGNPLEQLFLKLSAGGSAMKNV